MCAVQFNSNKLYNPGEEIVDPYIPLHLLEKVENFARPSQPNP